MNRRDEIKEKIRDLLDGNTTASDQVYVSRVRRLDEELYPALFIYTLKEDPDRESRVESQYSLKCNVQIDIATKLTEEWEKEADLISGEVEDILLGLDPREFITNCEDIEYTGTEIILSGAEDRSVICGALLNFEVTYSAQPPIEEDEDTETVDVYNLTGDPNET